MAAETTAVDLQSIVILLGAAVVAVPLFKRIKLGSVLGYLAAGLVIGPFGLGLFSDAMAILHVAELGVVMFLFIIGLEMEPKRLWSMRRDIFGMGLAQLILCMGLLSLVGVALGYDVVPSMIAGTGFVLTSTAIVMQMLQERGDISTAKGQRIVSILLLEDLAIVPLLAVVAFLAPGGADLTWADRARDVGIGLGAIGVLVAAGLYLLNPMFRLLAASRAREVMTAAALLVWCWGRRSGCSSAACPQRWGRFWPVCCCRSQVSAISWRPMWSRSGGCCSGFSSSPSGWRWICRSLRKTGNWWQCPYWP
jgi:Kef-type K+ transport system membrane component KefB